MTHAPEDEQEIEASRAPLMEHLVELRRRLIVCIAALGVGFIGCFFFAKPIIAFLYHPFDIAQDVMALQKAHGSRGPFDLLRVIFDPSSVKIPKHEMINLISTAPLENFFSQVKVAMFGAIVLCFPILAFQLYRFVAPGLYRKERNAFLPFLLASPILFVAGAALVYFIMLPFILWFSLNQQSLTATVHVQLMPKLADYLDLVTKLLLACASSCRWC